MAVSECTIPGRDIHKSGDLPDRIRKVGGAVDSFWRTNQPYWCGPDTLLTIGGYALADIVVLGSPLAGGLTLYVENGNVDNPDGWPCELVFENWSVYVDSLFSSTNRKGIECRICGVKVTSPSYHFVKRFLGLSVQRCLYDPVNGFFCDTNFLDDYNNKKIRVVGNDFPVMNLVNADHLQSRGYTVDAQEWERMVLDLATDLESLEVPPDTVWDGSNTFHAPLFVTKYGYSPLYLLRRMSRATRTLLKDCLKGN